MAGPRWTILDMLQDNLYCPSPKLVRILCVVVYPSVLLHAPTCQEGTFGGPDIQRLENPEGTVCLTNWQLEG
jgi:hypothetical protein